jgi:hypothetical protein
LFPLIPWLSLTEMKHLSMIQPMALWIQGHLTRRFHWCLSVQGRLGLSRFHPGYRKGALESWLGLGYLTSDPLSAGHVHTWVTISPACLDPHGNFFLVLGLPRESMLFRPLPFPFWLWGSLDLFVIESLSVHPNSWL